MKERKLHGNLEASIKFSFPGNLEIISELDDECSYVSNNYFYFLRILRNDIYRILTILSNYRLLGIFFRRRKRERKREREKELKRRYGASGLTHGVVAYRVMCHWAGRNRGKPG